MFGASRLEDLLPFRPHGHHSAWPVLLQRRVRQRDQRASVRQPWRQLLDLEDSRYIKRPATRPTAVAFAIIYVGKFLWLAHRFFQKPTWHRHSATALVRAGVAFCVWVGEGCVLVFVCVELEWRARTEHGAALSGDTPHCGLHEPAEVYAALAAPLRGSVMWSPSFGAPTLKSPPS